MKNNQKFTSLFRFLGALSLVLPLALSIYGFKAARQFQGHLFELLGMEEVMAKSYLWTSFERGYLYYSSNISAFTQSIV